MSHSNARIYLSSRKVEILAHVARGETNKAISALLGVSEQTIKGHMVKIFLTLGAVDRTHAVVLAHLAGLLRLECPAEHTVSLINKLLER